MRWFRNRQEVAEHLQISRMTLNRWEKRTPLIKETLPAHTFSVNQDDVNEWYQKLREKYRPYNSWKKDRITRPG